MAVMQEDTPEQQPGRDGVQYSDWQTAARNRPGRISGMAIPGSVYLSNGVVRAGSSMGLYMSMLVLGLTLFVATIVLFLLVWALDPWVDTYVLGSFTRATLPEEVENEKIWLVGFEIVRFFIFLVVLRFTPLTAYHAAEHMTVHAIEAGYPLTPENVRQMPRVHARCGTSLLAGILPAIVLLPLADGPVGWALVGGVLALGWIGRRPLGAAVQYLFTTRPPSDRQLEAGLRAGRELLQRNREYRGGPVGRLRAAWNRGAIQMVVVLGVLIVGQALISPWLMSHYFLWLDF